MGYKPAGSPTVSPYLVVEDAQAALDFIEAVFGVEPPQVFRRDDGSIMHAEARIEDSVVMIGQMPGGPDAHVHVYVHDADAVFQRAIDAGGTVVQPVELKPEGDRRGGVRDSNGTTWWLSTTG
jgi:uncharacterized glyoxalase superfamily protein PhnB